MSNNKILRVASASGLAGLLFLNIACDSNVDASNKNIESAATTTNNHNNVVNPYANIPVTTTMASSVSQWGITWTFDRDYEIGQFVNGDYFIIGPATVTAVSPGPNGGLNGSMLNPEAVYPAAQGYDSRAWAYQATTRMDFPFTLQPNQSLVSSESWPNLISRKDLIGRTVSATHHTLRTAAVLTCLATKPAYMAFRPPYAGTTKPLIAAADINLNLLPQLSPPQRDSNSNYDYDDIKVGGGPTSRDYSKTVAEQFKRYFERVQILHVFDWQARMTHPTENMPNYHEQYYHLISEAALLLLMDLPDKLPFLIAFLQFGIDAHYVTLTGDGDSSLAKFPIIFAGVLLNRADMLTNSSRFRTDWQTYYIADRLSNTQSNIVAAGQSWTGQTVLWRQDRHASTSLNNLVEFEHLHPSEWDDYVDNPHSREDYRRINSSTWAGHALAARLLPGAKQAWQHAPFFDYVDRWMSEGDTNYQQAVPPLYGPLLINAKATTSDFATEMWHAYRGN